MKKLFLISVMLFLAIVTVACGGDDGENENSENGNENTEQEENTEGENAEGEGQQQEVEEVTADEFPDVVATVNGEDITNEQLALNVNAIQQQYQMYGMNIEENKDSIQQTALDQLINTEVIEQSAEEDGIEATEEEVKKDYDELVSQLKEQYETDNVQEVFEENDVTEEEIKNDIRRNIVISKFMDENIEDAEVTEEELEEAYENYRSQAEEMEQEVQDYSAMKPQLEQQLQTQKAQEEQQKFIDELREQQEIEVLI